MNNLFKVLAVCMLTTGIMYATVHHDPFHFREHGGLFHGKSLSDTHRKGRCGIDPYHHHRFHHLRPGTTPYHGKRMDRHPRGKGSSTQSMFWEFFKRNYG
jgi:hypothetical protein